MLPLHSPVKQSQASQAEPYSDQNATTKPPPSSRNPLSPPSHSTQYETSQRSVVAPMSRTPGIRNPLTEPPASR
jgi:hypothetical protein